jgi:hypothetical protein
MGDDITCLAQRDRKFQNKSGAFNVTAVIVNLQAASVRKGDLPRDIEPQPAKSPSVSVLTLTDDRVRAGLTLLDVPTSARFDSY